MWNRASASTLVAASARDGVMTVIEGLCSTLGFDSAYALEERTNGGWQLVLADPVGGRQVVPVPDPEAFRFPLTLVERSKELLRADTVDCDVANVNLGRHNRDVRDYFRTACDLAVEETSKVLLTLRVLGLRSLDVSVFRRMVVQYGCLHLAGQFEAWFKWTTLMYWFSCMSTGRLDYKNVRSEEGAILQLSVQPKRPDGLTAFVAGTIGPGCVYRFLVHSREMCRTRGQLRDWVIPDTIKQMKDQCAPVTAVLKDSALIDHRKVLTSPLVHHGSQGPLLSELSESLRAVVHSIYPDERLEFGPQPVQRTSASTRVPVQTPSCSASFEKGRSEGGAVTSIMTRLSDHLPPPATQPNRRAAGVQVTEPLPSRDIRRFVPEMCEQCPDGHSLPSDGTRSDDELHDVPEAADACRTAITYARADWHIRLMTSKYLDRPRRIRCTPLIVCDPCKARPITKAESLPYWLALHLQRCLHGNLRKHPNFVLTGTMLDPEIVEEVVLPAHSHGQSLFSADFKSATDLIDPMLCRLTAGLISDRLGLHHVFHEIFQSSLVGHEIHWDSLYGGVGIQRRGQLMGSPTSFPVLCIINAACIHAAYTLHLREIADGLNGHSDCTGYHVVRPSCKCLRFLAPYLGLKHGRHIAKPIPLLRSGRPSLPFLVNGDDALSTGCMGFYAHLTAFYRAAGLQLSPGKNIVSTCIAEMNSVRMVVHHDDRPGPLLERGHGYRATPIPCVMSGIAFTPTRDDRLDPLAEIESLSDVAWQLIDRGLPEWRGELLDLFTAGRPELRHPALCRIPWWGPKHLGCLGLPPYPKRGDLAWSPEQLKWMAYFRGLANSRLEEDWRNLWRRGKTISAPVHDWVTKSLRRGDGHWVWDAVHRWEQDDHEHDSQYAALAQAAVFGNKLLPNEREVDVRERGRAITRFVDAVWKRAQRVPDSMATMASLQRAMHAPSHPRHWVWDSPIPPPVEVDLRDFAILHDGAVVYDTTQRA